MPQHPDAVPRMAADDTEVVVRTRKRTFTADYKRQIVAECDAAESSLHVGQILRREGLYSSHLTKWRQALASGVAPRPPGRPKKSEAETALQRERDQLQRKTQRLEEELRRAQLIIEAQKKLSELLANLGPSKTDSSE